MSVKSIMIVGVADRERFFPADFSERFYVTADLTFRSRRFTE